MNPVRRVAGPRAWIALLVAACGIAWPSLGASQSIAGAPKAEVMSLHDAVTQALNRNPTLLNARAMVDQADLSLRVARSAFTPKVFPSMLGSLGQTEITNQSYGVNVSQKFHGGTELRANIGANSYRNQIGNYYNSDATFQLNQPLLRGFGSSIATAPLFDAQARVSDAGRQVTLTEQQVALEVAAAYYAVVVQERVSAVLVAAMERAQNLRDASVARLAAGRVSQLDVLRAEQLVGQSEVQLLDADGSLADAKDRLRVLIGSPADAEFSLEDQISVDAAQVDLAEAVRIALEGRLELRTALSAVTESDRAIVAARSQLRPQVDVSLALTRRETADDLGSAFGLDRFRVATFTTISMPVDRTAEDAGLRNALIERTRRQRDLDSARDRVAQEARQAVRRQERALKTLALARSSVELAEKEVEVATFRFQRGLSNNLDLINAQTTFRGVQSQEIAAQADVALARLRLRAALGLLNPSVDIK